MKVVDDFPPNIKEIRRVLKPKTKGTIFAYDGVIYAPGSGGFLDTDLIIHEQAHLTNQKKTGAKEWWSEYLSNPGFRLIEEVIAYQAQYVYANTYYTRSRKRELLRKLSRDLSSSMYGNVCTKAEAKYLITRGLK